MRGRAHRVPGLAGLVILAASGCDCPKSFRGVNDGDTIQTTIAHIDGTPFAQSTTPSCGELGDLTDGAVLTSRASVTTDTSGAQRCFNVLAITPRALTTGTLQQGADGKTVLHLPDGCTGEFFVYFDSPNDSSSYFDSPPDGGQPPWWLIRRFVATGDMSLCFSGTAAPRSVCIDAFVAENARN